MTIRPGRGLPAEPAARNQAVLLENKGGRGFDFGATTGVSGGALVTTDTDLLLGWLDVGHLPFVARKVAAVGASGTPARLQVGIWRIDPEDVTPGSWRARLAASAESGLVSAEEQVVMELSREVELDRTKGYWLIGARGTAAAFQLRAAAENDLVGRTGFSIACSALPAEILSSDLNDDGVPALAALSLAATRLFGY